MCAAQSQLVRPAELFSCIALAFTVPRFGLGAAPLGGTGFDAFSVASDTRATETVLHCLDKGVTFFDSAPLYGSGLSEQRLGSALSGVKRSQIIVESKIGVVVNPNGSMGCSPRRTFSPPV